MKGKISKKELMILLIVAVLAWVLGQWIVPAVLKSMFL